MTEHLRHARCVWNVHVQIEVHCVKELTDGDEVENRGEHSRLVKLKIAHFLKMNDFRDKLFNFFLARILLKSYSIPDFTVTLTRNDEFMSTFYRFFAKLFTLPALNPRRELFPSEVKLAIWKFSNVVAHFDYQIFRISLHKFYLARKDCTAKPRNFLQTIKIQLRRKLFFRLL